MGSEAYRICMAVHRIASGRVRPPQKPMAPMTPMAVAPMAAHLILVRALGRCGCPSLIAAAPEYAAYQTRTAREIPVVILAPDGA